MPLRPARLPGEAATLCALLELDFETDTNVCSAATKALPATSVDGQLGKFIWYW